jgi:hypothetical protein
MVSERMRAAAEAAVVLARTSAALAGDGVALDLAENYLRTRRWRKQTVYGWRDPLRPSELVPVLSAVRQQISRDLERVRRPIERGLAGAADPDHAE